MPMEITTIALFIVPMGDVGKERKQKLSNIGVKYHESNAFIVEIKYTPAEVSICMKPSPAVTQYMVRCDIRHFISAIQTQ